MSSNSSLNTHHSLLSLIGNTPLVKLSKINPNKNVTVYGKLEGNNPGGSVKDRAAYYLIKGAVARGDVRPGMKLIEATSGNTGIALAMIARLFGIEIELAMPENATRERVLTMEAYGAKVILTPQSKGMEGARDYAVNAAATGKYYMLNQFDNTDCPLAHYETTGPEIWRDTQGAVTHFVSAMGTTGTIMGTSQFLKGQDTEIQIIGAQPSEGSQIPGIRRWPKEYLPKIYDPSRVDRLIDVSEEEARKMTRLLAKEEGVFCGMSSGGAVAVTLRLASELKAGTIVTIICDRGDRYLSSNLFA